MPSTRSVLVGYLLWIFGFLGAHRFYFGKPVTGTIRFFTLGVLGVHRMYMGKRLNDQVTERNAA